MSLAIEAIRSALDAADLIVPIVSTGNLSGGCIHQVIQVTFVDGTRVVAKINHADALVQFEEEANGLRALAATNTVIVPKPLITFRHDNHAVLLMTAIESPIAPPKQIAWQRFGTELAALHSAAAGERYGFETDNHIGSTVQPNHWCDDWVEFNAVHRIGYQLKLARDRRLLNADEAQAVQAVIDRLDRLLPHCPKPALLHGDLWSGNALPTVDDRIALIDPACYVGDGWADIAMMKLFGGFPNAVHDAYAAHVDDQAEIESRLLVYQLYHMLNHVNIFGKAYVGQALALAKSVVG
jgi:fructosamine-3-kinase